MSLILDALRKSDRERRLGEVPTIATPAIPQQPHRRAPRLYWLIAALIFVNLAVVAMVLLRDDTVPASTAASTPIAQQRPVLTEIAPAPVAPAPELKSVTSSPVPKSGTSIADMLDHRKKAPRVSAETTPRPRPAAPASAPAQPKQKMPAPPEPASVAMVKQPPAAVARPRTKEIPYVNQLPEDFRRNLPTLAINVYVYADDPNERFVIINMNKYKSGQRIKEGPLIEAIDADSLVLDHAGRRFRLPRP